eukprot:TRINITY_DN1716_c0_g1_i6.p1 TRINITY_DN1716_c0_g1~~TRINITY_DN1716_c0_g1_i6.p1  ORF type:complete len:242 (-),score=58.37 TRINITY_DN1716_c0_g1_i6:16-741(-)
MCIRDSSSDNQYAIIAQTEEFSSVSLGAKTWATFEKFLRAPSTICEGQWTRIRPDPDSPLFLTDYFDADHDAWVLFALSLPTTVWNNLSPGEQNKVMVEWGAVTKKPQWEDEADKCAVVDMLQHPRKLTRLLSSEYAQMSLAVQKDFNRTNQQDRKFADAKSKVIDSVAEDLRLLHDREDRLAAVDQNAEVLVRAAEEFETTSKEVKQKYWWENIKCMVALGVTAVLVLGAVIAVIALATR